MGCDEIISFMKVLFIFMVSMLYCYFIASKLPKGKLRLISLLPIFSFFAILPLYFSSFLFTISTALFITWLTTFKLILFAFGSGPLASDPPLSFPLFVSVAFFPTRIKYNKTITTHEVDQETPLKLPLNLPTKVVIFALLVWGNYYHNIELLCCPIAKASIICAIMLYFYLDVVMSISNAFIRLTFGVEVHRPFNEPYLATSLQNFWGRRWNLVVSETLHDMVYKPIRYVVGSPRWVAVIAVFFVSGLMHEILYCYIIGTTAATFEATLFFVVHGVCVAIEIELKVMLKKRWRLHWIVSGPLTMVFVYVTCNWLFFPPLLRMGHLKFIVLQ